MIVIYTKEREPQEIFNTILTREEVEISGGLFIDHKELKEEDCIVVEVDRPFQNPISDDLTSIREMTREELILQKGKTELLQDGEKFEDGHIVQVPNPSTQYLKYSWNREKFTWELITTKEELQQAKTNLILQHNKKRKEIVALNEEAEFFNVSESVTKANCELEEIRAKINEIDKVIEEMNKNAKVQQQKFK